MLKILIIHINNKSFNCNEKSTAKVNMRRSGNVHVRNLENVCCTKRSTVLDTYNFPWT
jgi:hypothetical protein